MTSNRERFAVLVRLAFAMFLLGSLTLVVYWSYTNQIEKNETAVAKLLDAGCHRETAKELSNRRGTLLLWRCPGKEVSFFLDDYRNGDIQLSE